MLPAIARRQYIYAVLMALGILRTMSVGAILAGITGLVVLVVYTDRMRSWIHRHAATAIVITMVIVVCMITMVMTIANQRARYWSMRLDYWETAVLMIHAAPLTGTGPGSYQRTTFITGFDPAYHGTKPLITPHAHNLYLHVASEYGLPATVILLLIATAIYRQCTPTGRAAILVIAVHGLVDATTLYMPAALCASSVIYLSWRGSRQVQP